MRGDSNTVKESIPKTLCLLKISKCANITSIPGAIPPKYFPSTLLYTCPIEGLVGIMDSNNSHSRTIMERNLVKDTQMAEGISKHLVEIF